MLPTRVDTTRERPATFLFLQGIASPFFADLGQALLKRGHRVRRINFSSGDWLFWRLGSDNYRGPRDGWDAYIAGYIVEHGVTDIVLFGDCRPYHVAAREAASPLGVRIHVFEEGYLRPNWVTCELGGVNGHSSLPRCPDEIRAIARRLPLAGRAMPASGDMARRSLWDVAYNVANIGFPYFFPHFRSHRPIHIAAEYVGWIKKFAGRASTRRQARELNEIYLARKHEYFLLPLQLDSDYQIRIHSPFLGVEGFMDRGHRVLCRPCQHRRAPTDQASPPRQRAGQLAQTRQELRPASWRGRPARFHRWRRPPEPHRRQPRRRPGEQHGGDAVPGARPSDGRRG